MEEEEHLLADSPPTVPEDHVCSLTTCWKETIFGGVKSVCAGVGEGRELAEDCHV